MARRSTRGKVVFVNAAVALTLLALANGARARAAVPPVRWAPAAAKVAKACPDRALLACARRHGLASRAVGIDRAWGQPTPAAVLVAWLQSPPHRRILLSPLYRRAGVAVRARRWTLVLAR